MGNMSYCRFQNTLQDLKECLQYLETDLASKEEEQARDELVKLMSNF